MSDFKHVEFSMATGKLTLSLKPEQKPGITNNYNTVIAPELLLFVTEKQEISWLNGRVDYCLNSWPSLGEMTICITQQDMEHHHKMALDKDNGVDYLLAPVQEKFKGNMVQESLIRPATDTMRSNEFRKHSMASSQLALIGYAAFFIPAFREQLAAATGVAMSDRVGSLKDGENADMKALTAGISQALGAVYQDKFMMSDLLETAQKTLEQDEHRHLATNLGYPSPLPVELKHPSAQTVMKLASFRER